MSNPREILIAAREKITTPERWCQGAHARDEGGQTVLAKDPAACVWCIDGALWAVTRFTQTSARASASILLGEQIGAYSANSIHKWNDAPERTHAEVLAAFDRAIEESEG